MREYLLTLVVGYEDGSSPGAPRGAGRTGATHLSSDLFTAVLGDEVGQLLIEEIDLLAYLLKLGVQHHLVAFAVLRELLAALENVVHAVLPHAAVAVSR